MVDIVDTRNLYFRICFPNLPVMGAQKNPLLRAGTNNGSDTTRIVRAAGEEGKYTSGIEVP